MGCAPAPCWSRRPCPRRDFVVLESTPSPAHHPAFNHPPSRTSVRASGSSAAGRSLPRPRAAGGSCAPPRVTCSRSILRVPGCRRPAGDSGPTVETPRPERRRSVERLAARADEERSLRRTKCRLCPVGRRAGAGGRAPAEIPWSLESTSAPQPIALPSTTPSSNGGGELYSPRGISESIPEPQPTRCAVDHHLVNQLCSANSERRRGPRILRRPPRWFRSRTCQWRW